MIVVVLEPFRQRTDDRRKDTFSEIQRRTRFPDIVQEGSSNFVVFDVGILRRQPTSDSVRVNAIQEGHRVPEIEFGIMEFCSHPHELDLG
jgi:hypothetical protein